MYPTAIAGLVLVVAACRYAAGPDARRRRVVAALAMLTFLVSCLGFVTGVIKSFQTATTLDGDVGNVVVTGVGESLNNLGLGLVLLVIAGIATAIGVARTGTKSGTADLHGV